VLNLGIGNLNLAGGWN